MIDFSATLCAFYGLGAMGAPIAAAFSLECGDIIVSDIDEDRKDHLCATSPARNSPSELPEASVVFLCLPNSAAVTEILETLLPRQGGQTRIIIDLGAHAPAFVDATVEHCSRHGVIYCDAPVFGTPSKATKGDLYFLFSGPQEVFRAFQKMSELSGFRCRYAGESGVASVVKVLNNALGISNLLASAEVLRVCEGMNIDCDMFIDVVEECGGIGGSTVFKNFASDMVRRADAGEGRLRIAAKDMQTTVDMAETSNTNVPLLRQTSEQFQTAYEAGLGEQQFSNIIKTI